MPKILRTLGLATSAAVLVSGASAAGALAANPIKLSLSGTTLVIDDVNGVGQAEIVKTNGSGFEITEANSNDVLLEGPGITAAVQYSATHWIVVPTSGVAITRITYNGNAGADGVNFSGVTNVPVSVFGGDGADYITGTALADTINAGTGNDTVFAGSGNDTITGWLGNDNLNGQNGDDKFFENDGYADTIDGGNDYDELTRDSLDTASNIELYR